MKRLILVLLVFLSVGFTSTDKLTYKCLIQMKAYDGEAAYVVVSILDQQGNYVETLHISGDDAEWYPEIEQWFDFYNQKETDIDAITGETIAAGQRAIFQVSISKKKLDAGNYQIRIESGVEDEGYYAKDVTIPLTTPSLAKKHYGAGFIEFVRWIKS